ncbi:MAG: PAS domain S-box protein, partial [Vicinamibacterales bacterium]
MHCSTEKTLDKKMAEQPKSRPEPIDVVWIGDPATAQQTLARRAPHITITVRDAKQALEGLRGGGLRPDLLVIDASFDGFDVIAYLGQLHAGQIDVPVVMLTRPGSDDLPARIGHLAVCDCVVKTPDFVLQLLPAFTQVRARHDLQALFRTSRQSQDRLRTIVEFQPAVTCVIGADGVLTAMNQAGLALLGAGRELVVGHPLMNFLEPDERPTVVDAIRRVCQGETIDLQHTIVRPDGRKTPARLRAVPFRSGDTVVALATIVEQTAAPAGEPDAAALDGARQEEREKLAIALRQAEVDVQRLEDERARLTAERETLETRAREDAAGIAAALKQAQAELASLQQERATWATAQSQLESQRADLESRLAASQKGPAEALRHMQAELEALKAEHASVAAARLQLESQIKQVHETSAVSLRSSQGELDAVRAERDSLASVRAELESRLRDGHVAETALRAAKAELVALQQQRQHWNDERAQFEVRLRSAAADSTGALEQAHKELTAVRADLERTSQEKRQVEANLREVAETFTGALKQTQADLESLRQERLRWADERAQLDARLNQSSEQSAQSLQQAQAELVALRNDHALLAQQKSELEARLRQASESLTAAEAAGQASAILNQDLS